MYKRIFILLILFFAMLDITSAADPLVLQAAKKELQRAIEGLKTEKLPPYYISYSIADLSTIRISASFGKIETDNSSHDRILDIDMRVGNYKFDNTHIIRGSSFGMGSSRVSVDIPLEDEESALRSAIWFATDKSYKKAIERYEKATSNKAVKVQEEDSSADFTPVAPDKYYDEIKIFKVDTDMWKDRIRKISAMFAEDPKIYDASVNVNVDIRTIYYVTSEGTELQLFEPYFRVFVSAKTKADDGMSLPLYKSYFSHTPEGLPDEKTLEKDTRYIIKMLADLRNAPLMKTFSGPAILSGEASGVFFHEIFGHRVEGHRQKDPNSSQTFKNFIGKKILPDFIDVEFDPSQTAIKGIELSGNYVYDDEGTRAQKVVTVEKGIFKDFLMSRSPIENFMKSNGHGRRQPGRQVVSRQSNLLVKASETVSTEDLRDKLRKECKKQNKEFGLYFVQVQGGYTFTSTQIPNAFNVNPLIVYKIFADERPDELVRGVDLIGTPLTTFSNVIGAADDLGVFNGICGAESGSVPVSASSPSLLVSLIEAQRKAKSQAKPPILDAPAVKVTN